MGAVRLKIDQKIKNLFTSKGLGIFFVILYTKRNLEYQCFAEPIQKFENIANWQSS